MTDTCKYRMFKTEEEVDEALAEYGCRPFAPQDWSFAEELPQKIRAEMEEKSIFYVLYPDCHDGVLYYYSPELGAFHVKLKYLNPFKKKSVSVDINGKKYKYFMTNDYKKLEKEIDFLPETNDWSPNYALQKNVMDKMSELGAIYSIIKTPDVYELNRYIDGCVPEIIDLVKFIADSWKKIFKQWSEDIYKKDDVNLLNEVLLMGEQYFEDFKIKEQILYADHSRILRGACAFNSKKVLSILLNLGADVNDANEIGVSPLMEASAKGYLDCMKLLLEHGANIEAKDAEERTALFFATLFRQQKAVDLLIKSGASQLSMNNFFIPDDNQHLTFNEQLTFYISRFTALGEHKACEIYKNSRMSKQTFSKIQSNRNKNYHPRKNNVLQLIIGMELSLTDAEKLLASAGYAFSASDKTDCIIKEFIQKKNYNINDIDYELMNQGLNSLDPINSSKDKV